jgi:hypothetical protein
MSRKSDTPRGQRRAAERAARKLVQSRQKLASLEPGGSPERPIEVTASPVIDVRARSLRCPLCQGAFELEDHTASTVGGRALRAAHVRCLQCGVKRSLWFRITSPLPD